MKYSSRNIRFHELIGLEVEILMHPDPSLIGYRGRVIWETAKTLIIDIQGKHLVILKSGALFRFKLPNGDTVEVRGDNLMGSPIERARRIVRGR